MDVHVMGVDPEKMCSMCSHLRKPLMAKANMSEKRLQMWLQTWLHIFSHLDLSF